MNKICQFGWYRDFNGYLKNIFGQRVQKIAIDAGLGCPNRDGIISSGGCIYCGASGSGTGAFVKDNLSVKEQIFRGREILKKRYGAKLFMSYFQSYTNTYAPIGVLKKLYEEALKYDDIVGLCVGTRPDCIEEAILDILASYIPEKQVWLELGLQSSHNKTLNFINRGHSVEDFEAAFYKAKSRNLLVCAHIILGLPGETAEMMLDTARFLGRLPIDGVKIHNLYVLEGTVLAEMLLQHKIFLSMGQTEYAELAAGFLELLPQNVIIQRLTGDPPAEGVIFPNWALEKQITLKLIKESLMKRKTFQGAKFSY